MNSKRHLGGIILLLAAGVVATCNAAVSNQVAGGIEPSKSNPRNSEGAFVTLKNGAIRLYYTQFYGGGGDNSPARIVSIESADGGRSWSSVPQVVVENTGGENVMSVSMLRLRSGKIAMFYLIKNGLHDCRPRIRYSDDEGITWSEPRLVIEAPGYFVVNNDRVIQLDKGRLVMPAAFHRLKGADTKSYRSFDARAIALWYFSDDEGATWREADNWWAIPVRSGSGLQEPGVVELSDGSIFSWARSDQGRQYAFTSRDAGKSWSPPEISSMESPNSPSSIKRLPQSPDLLAIYNDHSGKFPMVKGKRTPLISAISSDGGKTWPMRRPIESDPDGWYCYTAIHFVGDAVLLAYCAGDSKVGGLNRLRIRRISIPWLRGEVE
jgi:sialidase-1